MMPPALHNPASSMFVAREFQQAAKGFDGNLAKLCMVASVVCMGATAIATIAQTLHFNRIYREHDHNHQRGRD
jgi:type IV secretory pathway VirB2 component (pilin)